MKSLLLLDCVDLVFVLKSHPDLRQFLFVGVTVRATAVFVGPIGMLMADGLKDGFMGLGHSCGF